MPDRSPARSLCIQCSQCEAWHLHVTSAQWYPHRRYPCGKCGDATPSWIKVCEYDTPPAAVTVQGRVIIGEGVLIGSPSEFHAGSAEIVIGDHCDIASEATINCSDSHRRCLGLSNEIDCRPIFIGNRTCIGSKVVILGGVTLGERCVVGAGSVVRRGNYPPGTLFCPAQTIVREGYYA